MNNYLVSETIYPKLHLEQLKIFFLQAKQHQRLNKDSIAACFFYYLSQKLPHFTKTYFDLALCQINLGYWDGAEENLIKFHHYKPWDADTICNLAIVYWKKNFLKKALTHFKFNLKHYPHHFETHLNLAAFYYQYPKHRIQAIQHYQWLLLQKPELCDIRFNLAAALQKKGHYHEAIQHYQLILQTYPRHYASLYNLGCMYWNQKNKDAALFYWQQAYAIQSTAALEYILNFLIHQKIDPKQHQNYVEMLFDQYADDYDNHLIRELNYQIPLFLKKYSINYQFINVLDIGCGTGLCAQAIKSCCQNLIGIDISQEMLTKAKQKAIYQGLIQLDYTNFFQTNKKYFNLIMAIEVVAYIKDIKSFFQSCAEHLAENGHLWLTLEMSTATFRGRFQYQLDELQKLFLENRLEPISIQKIPGRLENGQMSDLIFLDLKKIVQTS